MCDNHGVFETLHRDCKRVKLYSKLNSQNAPFVQLFFDYIIL